MMTKWLLQILFTATALAADATENSDGSAGTTLPKLDYFLGIAANAQLGYDPHAVHGIRLADGGMAMVGFSMNVNENASQGYHGFVVKVGPCTAGYSGYSLLVDPSSNSNCQQGYSWVYKYSSIALGKSTKLLWIAEKDGKIAAVGLKQQSDTYYDRVLVQIDSSTGALVKEIVIPESGSTNGGFECVNYDTDGNLIASGFTESSQETLNFKSSGQVTQGKGLIQKFSTALFTAGDYTTTITWTKTLTSSNYPGSVKAFRIDSNKDVIALVGVKTSLVKVLGANGNESWNTGTTLHTNGQANDLTIVTEGFVIAGHLQATISGSTCVSTMGRITGVNTSGTQLWTQDHGNPSGGQYQFAGLTTGDTALVYTECWSIQTTYNSAGASDGFVFACGTGVEGSEICSNSCLTAAQAAVCNAEKRRTWRTMTYKATTSGSVWRRLDSYYDSSSTTVGASAAEYIAPTTNGGFMVVTDQSFGIGLQHLSGTQTESPVTVTTSVTTTVSWLETVTRYLPVILIVINAALPSLNLRGAVTNRGLERMLAAMPKKNRNNEFNEF